MKRDARFSQISVGFAFLCFTPNMFPFSVLIVTLFIYFETAASAKIYLFF